MGRLRRASAPGRPVGQGRRARPARFRPGCAGKNLPGRSGASTADKRAAGSQDEPMADQGDPRAGRPPWPAIGLSALAVAEAVATLVGVLATGMTFAAARDSFLISNASIGTVCALCGGLIAAYRPRNALGWLLLGVAVAQTATAAGTPWLARALAAGDGPMTPWAAAGHPAA